MTPPRRVVKDTPVEITQRTLARTCRFLPRAEINNLVLYILGVGAERYGVSLYGFALMATHYHLAARDVRGNMPKFVGFVNAMLARALNALQGETDKFWSGSGYVAVEPQDPRDLLGKIVYGLANPAAAGLVNRLEDFPGLIIAPSRIGVPITVERPDFFFKPKGSMPKEVTLTFEVPREFAHLGLEAYRALLWRELRRKEAEHRAERKRTGRRVVGTQKLREVAHYERATSWEAWGTLRPVIAAKLKAARVAALRALKAFREAYRAAWERWSAGDREVTFPAGTWWVVVYAGAEAVG